MLTELSRPKGLPKANTNCPCLQIARIRQFQGGQTGCVDFEQCKIGVTVSHVSAWRRTRRGVMLDPVLWIKATS